MAEPSLPRVLATAALPPEQYQRLAAHSEVQIWNHARDPTPAELADLSQSADGVLSVLTDRIDQQLLDRCPRLRVVSNRAVGVDNLDLVALTARGIPAGHTPGVLTEATADLTVALILAATRRLVPAVDAVAAGRWQTTWERSSPYGFDLTEPGTDLATKTLGVIGTGRIGLAVASRMKAFGMTVIGLAQRTPVPAGIEPVELLELLERSDVVTVHVPLTSATRRLIGREQLRRMRTTAFLVNTSRGQVLDQGALVDALEQGWIAGAALDVTDPEPLEVGHPLLTLPQCLVLPHAGSATRETRDRMAAMAVDNLIAGLEGRRLAHCANPDAYRLAAEVGGIVSEGRR